MENQNRLPCRCKKCRRVVGFMELVNGAVLFRIGFTYYSAIAGRCVCGGGFMWRQPKLSNWQKLNEKPRIDNGSIIR